MDHPLLRRQLRRLGLSADAPPSPEAWRTLLDHLERTYGEADQDRYLMERSLTISSREMQELNASLARSARSDLAQAHALHLATIEASPDGVLVVGADRRVLGFNLRFAAIWAIPPEVIAARDDRLLLGHVMPLLADPEEFRGRIAALYAHADESSRDEIRLVDGRILDRHSRPVPVGEGRVGRVWFFRDVTAQRLAEEALSALNVGLETKVLERTEALGRANAELDANLRQLAEAQDRLVHAGKMAAIGTLVAGVAHELNNPLAFVLGNLTFVRESIGALVDAAPSEAVRGAELLEALQELESGASRMAGIVRDLRMVSRRDQEARAPVDVEKVLRTAVSVSGPELRHRAEIAWELEPIPPVEANEARLTQVFLNLVVNAAQAMPEGRAGNRVTIAAARRGDELVVEIRDNGLGIPPAVLPRLFDPFFTTKPVGRGTGLGLSICDAIVSALGGRIEVESEPGHGATFRVRLPASTATVVVAPAPRAASPSLDPAAPRGRVLVIDDEENVGRVLRRLLREAHDVTWVGNGEEGLARLLGGEAWDVVFCDLMMPGISGAELHARLDLSAPELARRLVFMTGGAFTEEAQRFLANVPNDRLEKPFDLDRLRQFVEAAVERRHPG